MPQSLRIRIIDLKIQYLAMSTSVPSHETPQRKQRPIQIQPPHHRARVGGNVDLDVSVSVLEIVVRDRLVLVARQARADLLKGAAEGG